jgi:hypothetical protein
MAVVSTTPEVAKKVDDILAVSCAPIQKQLDLGAAALVAGRKLHSKLWEQGKDGKGGCLASLEELAVTEKALKLALKTSTLVVVSALLAKGLPVSDDPDPGSFKTYSTAVQAALGKCIAPFALFEKAKAAAQIAVQPASAEASPAHHDTDME